MHTKFTIEKEYDGILLRTYLKNALFLSRAMVSELKRRKGIDVNGEKVTVRYVLKEGDVLDLMIEDESESENIPPVDIPINIIYEDEDIVLVDKPPFMPVHPSHGHRCDTLANALRYRYIDKNFVMRAINRLDRNTSGIVLVAKNRRAAYILSTQMKNREIRKKYMALVEGVPPDSFTVEVYVKRKEASVIERCVCEKDDAGAEYSLSEGKVVEQNYKNGKYTLVELVPHTGRTHQLRVHMAHFGFPIAGDELYGNGGDRHMLHCCFLEFKHPSTGEKISFSSPHGFLEQGFLN